MSNNPQLPYQQPKLNTSSNVSLSQQPTINLAGTYSGFQTKEPVNHFTDSVSSSFAPAFSQNPHWNQSFPQLNTQGHQFKQHHPSYQQQQSASASLYPTHSPLLLPPDGTLFQPLKQQLAFQPSFQQNPQTSAYSTTQVLNKFPSQLFPQHSHTSSSPQPYNLSQLGTSHSHPSTPTPRFAVWKPSNNEGNGDFVNHALNQNRNCQPQYKQPPNIQHQQQQSFYPPAYQQPQILLQGQHFKHQYASNQQTAGNHAPFFQPIQQQQSNRAAFDNNNFAPPNIPVATPDQSHLQPSTYDNNQSSTKSTPLSLSPVNPQHTTHQPLGNFPNSASNLTQNNTLKQPDLSDNLKNLSISPSINSQTSNNVTKSPTGPIQGVTTQPSSTANSQSAVQSSNLPTNQQIPLSTQPSSHSSNQSTKPPQNTTSDPNPPDTLPTTSSPKKMIAPTDTHSTNQSLTSSSNHSVATPSTSSLTSSQSANQTSQHSEQPLDKDHSRHYHQHHHHQNAKGGREDDDDDDDDDNDEDEDEEDDEEDEEYTTEEEDTSNSDNPDYDLENQRYFSDHSTVRSMADKSHQSSKKCEAIKAHATGRRNANTRRHTNNYNNVNNQEASLSRVVDLARERDLIPHSGFEINSPHHDDATNKPVCNPDLLACTLNALPNTSTLHSKARLPLGVIVHPLMETKDVVVVKGGQIARCRLCRMYINPYVVVLDHRKWKCSMCSRLNEFPGDFMYNKRLGQYTNGQHRPELNSASYEIVASPDYVIRTPQPPRFLFLLDVSFNAIETGYLQTVCERLMDNLDEFVSKNKNTQIAFMTFNSHVHYYKLDASLSQPQVYQVVDIEDIELPTPSGLMVNIAESKVLIMTLLSRLPCMFEDTKDVGNCLGTAVRAAHKLIESYGGRVSVFQTKLPDVGEGALKSREDPNKRAADTVEHLAAVTDHYKRLALECSSTHVSYDIFMLNSQYSDLATISTLSRYSGGCLYYFSNYHYATNAVERRRLESCLDRYFGRDVGFEAVMRIRCTRGLSLKKFYGIGFVRSLDLLSLPNLNADTSFAVELSIDDQLNDSFALVQAALLYTNSNCERRIRIHTLCLPVTAFLNEVFMHANNLAIVGMVAKMAVERAQTSSVVNSKEACVNVASDMLNAYAENLSPGQRSIQLASPYILRSLPLLMLALLKSLPFRLGISTKLDDRIYHIEHIRSLPLCQLMPLIHPCLYPLHRLYDGNCFNLGDRDFFFPPILPLSASSLERNGAFLLDDGSHMILWIFPAIGVEFLNEVLGVKKFSDLKNELIELPDFANDLSENARFLISHLNSLRPFPSPLSLFRDDHRDRNLLYDRLIEDKTPDSCNMSYHDFLRHLINIISYN